MNNLQWKYIGTMNINNNKYEVIEDESRNVINVFYRNTKELDVECWSFNKDIIEEMRGKTLLGRVSVYWNMTVAKGDCEDNGYIQVQTFPLKFWIDVIKKFKDGTFYESEGSIGFAEENSDEHKQMLDMTTEGDK